jgi:hypothetical protein
MPLLRSVPPLAELRVLRLTRSSAAKTSPSLSQSLMIIKWMSLAPWSGALATERYTKAARMAADSGFRPSRRGSARAFAFETMFRSSEQSGEAAIAWWCFWLPSGRATMRPLRPGHGAVRETVRDRTTGPGSAQCGSDYVRIKAEPPRRGLSGTGTEPTLESPVRNRRVA